VPGSEAHALAEAARQAGYPLPAAAVRQLLAYRDLIAKWNRVYNLTAVRKPDDMRVQHLHDSLSLVGPLRRHTQGQAARVLDVGSGAGLPGVVLAIACPELAVTCVDTVAKKASFLQQCALELHLPNLTARHARVEDLVDPPFDVITSRAFAALDDFVALTRPRLTAGGVWVAMKGVRPDDEIARLDGIDVFHVEPLDVPGLTAQRCLVWMRPA
jgi:16S rRNA (guanine527-N7)-methyltransferase